MNGKGKYTSFYLMGERSSDGVLIRLGSASSLETAREKAITMLRSTSGWRRINIHDRKGRVITRVTKPPL
jgi:hypothetical protein